MYKRVLAVVVMFLVTVVLTHGGICVSHAAEEKETSQTKSVQSKEKKESTNSKAEQNKTPEGAVDSHASHMRFYFQDVEMDFNFGSLVLGATVNHGCEIGEAFYTAAQIKDCDAASWQLNGSRWRAASRPGASNRWPRGTP